MPAQASTQAVVARRAALVRRPALRAPAEGTSLVTAPSITAVGPETTVAVSVLGSFSLSVDGERCELPPTAQRLVALLALHRRPVRRLFVAATLWIDATEDHANASLRTALWRVSAATGGIVSSRGGMLSLDPSVAIDLDEQSGRAKRVLSTASHPSPDDVDALSDATDVLPDWYDDWVIAAREQFRQMRLHALEGLCRRLAECRRFAESTQVGLAAVAAEPLRESAHRTLIEAHLLEGNVNEALRQYSYFRGLLREKLDLEPSPAMERLLLAVRIP